MGASLREDILPSTYEWKRTTTRACNVLVALSSPVWASHESVSTAVRQLAFSYRCIVRVLLLRPARQHSHSVCDICPVVSRTARARLVPSPLPLKHPDSRRDHSLPKPTARNTPDGIVSFRCHTSTLGSQQCAVRAPRSDRYPVPLARITRCTRTDPNARLHNCTQRRHARISEVLDMCTLS